MAHQGKLIEHAAQAQLVDAGTMAGARVHRDRIDPFKKGAIPAIALYIPDEETDRPKSEDNTSRELTREADLELQAFVGGSDAEVVSDLMWDIQEQIENAFNADPYLGGTAAESILVKVSRELGEANGGSSPIVGVVTMIYAVTFRTTPLETDELDDFKRVKATHDLAGGVADSVPVVDQFNVQETTP